MKINVIRWIVILNNQCCLFLIFRIVLCVFIYYFECILASVLGAACLLCVQTRTLAADFGLFTSLRERMLKQGPHEANTNLHCSFLS